MQLQELDYQNLNAIFRQGGYYELPTDGVWQLDRLHGFCQNKFYFLTEGSFSITIGERSYTAQPGDWFFIPAGTMHCYNNIPGVEMKKYWMHFDLYPSANLLSSLQVVHKVNVADNAKVMALFAEFVRLRKSRDLSDRLRVKAIILNLLAEYICLADRNTEVAGEERDEDMRNVLSYIQENFRRNLTTEELAGVCHMHPTHFIRAFKLRMAQTPHQYISDVRMEYARQLLDRSDRSVIQIAEDSGFYDLAHFSRTFKQYYSMTPSQYRKALPDNR